MLLSLRFRNSILTFLLIYIFSNLFYFVFYIKKRGDPKVFDQTLIYVVEISLTYKYMILYKRKLVEIFYI